MLLNALQFLSASPMRRDVGVLHSQPYSHIRNAHCTSSPSNASPIPPTILPPSRCVILWFFHIKQRIFSLISTFLPIFLFLSPNPYPYPSLLAVVLLMCFVAVDSCRSRSCGWKSPAPVNEGRIVIRMAGNASTEKCGTTLRADIGLGLTPKRNNPYCATACLDNTNSSIYVYAYDFPIKS